MVYFLSTYNRENENHLVSKEEFEDFSESLYNKTDHISSTLDKHEEQISQLDNSVQSVRSSVEHLERNIQIGLSGLDKRFTDLSSFLTQQSKSMEEQNVRENINRSDRLDEQLNSHDKKLDAFMKQQSEKLDYTAEKVEELDKNFDVEGDKKRTFWTNMITAGVGIIIAIINIIPLLK